MKLSDLKDILTVDSLDMGSYYSVEKCPYCEEPAVYYLDIDKKKHCVKSKHCIWCLKEIKRG